MKDNTVFLKMCRYLLDFELIEDQALLKERKTIGSITKALKITNNEVYEVFKELSNQKALSIPPLNTPIEYRSWEIDFEKLRNFIKTA